ncbi:MAG: outer membrane lipoprotein carrier protein LolA [Oligoflexales bacterium]
MKHFVIALVCLGLHAPAHGATKEALMAKYRGAKNVRAEIVQEKQAEYLLKPLISHVTMTFDQKTLVWDIKDPVPSRIVLEQDRIEVDGKPMPPVGAKSQESLASIVRLARQLVAGDLEGLEKDYNVKMIENALLVEPKKESVLKKMTISFNDSLDLKTIEMVLPDEKLTLRFQSIVQSRG